MISKNKLFLFGALITLIIAFLFLYSKNTENRQRSHTDFSRFLNLFSSPYHYYIPIKYTSTRIPVLEIEIDRTSYSVSLALASHSELGLDEEILDKIAKKSLKPYKWRHESGAEYESKMYLLPHLTIGNLALSNIETRQLVHNPLRPTYSSYNECVGFLGAPFLHRYNLLLNFLDSVIIVSNDNKQLKELGFDLTKMSKIPISKDEKNFYIIAETDLGPKKFIINTSVTHNILWCTTEAQNLQMATSSKLVIGGVDFGKYELHPYSIGTGLTLTDGALGMDFLLAHPVYIDYQNGYLYIQK